MYISIYTWKEWKMIYRVGPSDIMGIVFLPIIRSIHTTAVRFFKIFSLHCFNGPSIYTAHLQHQRFTSQLFSHDFYSLHDSIVLIIILKYIIYYIFQSYIHNVFFIIYCIFYCTCIMYINIAYLCIYIQ